MLLIYVLNLQNIQRNLTYSTKHASLRINSRRKEITFEDLQTSPILHCIHNLFKHKQDQDLSHYFPTRTRFVRTSFWKTREEFFNFLQRSSFFAILESDERKEELLRERLVIRHPTKSQRGRKLIMN